MTVDEFESFWKIYENDIYRFCVHLVCDRDNADDLYQDVALTAFRKADAIDSGNNPKAYIFSIAVKLAHASFRKAKRRNTIAPQVSADEEWEAVPDAHENVAANTEKRQLDAAIHTAVGELDEKLRIPLVLYYFDERGTVFIAQIMGIPAGTVKSRLFKARAVLREKLEKAGYDYE